MSVCKSAFCVWDQWPLALASGPCKERRLWGTFKFL